MSQQADLAEVPRLVVNLIRELCERFGGRVLPDWYLKLPAEFYDNWPKEGYVRTEREETPDARQYWLEKATELLVQSRPDKGLLRTVLEAHKRSNPELAEKLAEKLRRLK
mgnify:FL=1